MAGTTSGDAGPIAAGTTVREAVSRYPGIEDVFERHGIQGCGGPQGPIEPIGFFARVHNVEPEALLRELNDYVRGRAGQALPATAAGAPQAEQSFYFLPIATAVFLALLAGLPLGIVAALGVAHDIGVASRWTQLVQAHGHLQVVAWVGLFILGIAYHVLPRFKGVPLWPERLVLPSFFLLLAGVVLRTVSQPWADAAGPAGLLAASAVLELAGALAFATVVAGTLGRARREAFDAFLLAAVGWLVAAAVANLVSVAEVVSAGTNFIPRDRDEPLLALQLYGFLTLFIFGVSLRVLPAFLSLQPTRTRLLAPVLVLFNAGLALRVVSQWGTAYGDWTPGAVLRAAPAYLLAAGVVAFALSLNVYLPSQRSEAADPERAYARLIRAAYVWLAFVAGLEVWLATRDLVGGDQASFLETSALRHALALGFITQMIFGVAYRALPVFAGKRLHSQRLVDVTFLLINVAAVTRVGPALIDAGTLGSRYDHLAGAGAVAWLAVAVFAVNIVRTVRARPPQPEIITLFEIEDREAGMEGEAFVVTPQSLVGDLLERVPGALELLVSRGFTPLADPEMRRAMAPRITLERACQIHPVDLEALLKDLNALAASK